MYNKITVKLKTTTVIKIMHVKFYINKKTFDICEIYQP